MSSNFPNGAISSGVGPFYSAQSVDPKMRKRIRQSADLSNIFNGLQVFNQGVLPAVAGIIRLGREAFSTPEPDIFIYNDNVVVRQQQQQDNLDSIINQQWQQYPGRGTRIRLPSYNSGNRAFQGGRSAASKPMYQGVRMGVEQYVGRTFGRERMMYGPELQAAGIPEQAAAFRTDGTFAYTDRLFGSGY